MTCCIAALADRAIILVSDKMVGTPIIQAEPRGLIKAARIHKDWWALYAGRADLPGELTARLKAAFPRGPLTVGNADAYLSTTLEEKWMSDTERHLLKPEGYSTATFRDEAPKKMPESVYNDVRRRRNEYALDAAVLLAGFDDNGNGHILSCYGFDSVDHDRFVPANHDLAGYYAIGTGAATAMWMMSYKDVGPALKPLAVAYHAVEGKYYAELGSGVGECTDLIVLRHNEDPVAYNTQMVNKFFIPIAQRLRPRKFKKQLRKKLERIEPINLGHAAW